MTAQLSCHVQDFIAIISLQLGWEQNEISIKFEFQQKKALREMGPCYAYSVVNLSIRFSHWGLYSLGHKTSFW